MVDSRRFGQRFMQILLWPAIFQRTGYKNMGVYCSMDFWFFTPTLAFRIWFFSSHFKHDIEDFLPFSYTFLQGWIFIFFWINSRTTKMTCELIAVIHFPKILINCRKWQKTYQTPFKSEKTPVLSYFELKIPQMLDCVIIYSQKQPFRS